MSDIPEVATFTCPRCGVSCIQEYYSPCDNCCQWLRYLAARKREVIKTKMNFPEVILECETCGDEVMRSELEGGKWIHTDDEFFVAKQGWKYDHDARPRYTDTTGQPSNELGRGSAEAERTD